MTEDLGEYKMFICKGCDVEFANPIKTDKSFYQTNLDYLLRDEIIIDNIGYNYTGDILYFLKNPPLKEGWLLDIGCGTGAFVKRALEKGFNACGIDFDHKAIEKGKKYFQINNLFAIDVKLFKNEFPNTKFDIITLFQVLEHLEEPLLFIQEAKELLKDDGVLVIGVPYKYRWPRLGEKWIDQPPHHLTRWGLPAMENVLRIAGFQIKKYYIEKFPFRYMSNFVYPYILRLLPKATIQGKQIHKTISTLTEEDREKLLLKSKFKKTLVNYFSLPLWVLLKLLGAKGPNLYVEAVKCE